MKYEALVAQLAANKGDDLFASKKEIKEILTGEIRSRYFYQKGRIEAALNFDSELEKAIEILKNKEEYNRILGMNSISNKAQQILFILLGVFIPTSIAISNFLIVGLVLCWILEGIS